MTPPDYSHIVVVIPTYNPEDCFNKLIDSLSTSGFKKIIVVNDGSDQAHSKPFESVGKSYPNLTFIEHKKNQGKGAALKSSFEHILCHYDNDTTHVATIDADGQHSVDDLKKLANLSTSLPDSLLLGCRKFDRETPLKSRMGNLLTRFLVNMLWKNRLTDTQTGMRLFPCSVLESWKNIPADRYEFEFNCLLDSLSKGMAVKEVPIETIYVENNIGSHFRPIVDSLKIYAVLFRFGFVSLTSFLLDISLFSIALIFSGNIFFSTYVSRMVSGTFNFYSNKTLVFHNNGIKSVFKEAGLYIALAFCIATLSAFLVDLFSSSTIVNSLLVKVVVDLYLFFVNFIIQNKLIFPNLGDNRGQL